MQTLKIADLIMYITKPDGRVISDKWYIDYATKTVLSELDSDGRLQDKWEFGFQIAVNNYCNLIQKSDWRVVYCSGKMNKLLTEGANLDTCESCGFPSTDDDEGDCLLCDGVFKA